MNRKNISSILIGACLSLTLTNVILHVNVFADAPPNPIARIYGADRYETAVNISKAGWVNGAETVILASGEDYADALCAVPLAKKYNAPILLTNKNKIPDSTLNELIRLNVKKIIVIGGIGSVSESVLNSIKKSVTPEVQRIYGKDRYATSLAVAKELGVNGNIVITSGEGFADALSIASISASKGMPIILASKSGLSKEAKSYICENKIVKSYIIGGNAVISSDVEKYVPNAVRIAGLDRFETNAKVLSTFSSDLDISTAYLALGDGLQGNEFADALSGSALASKNNAPIILTYGMLSQSTKDYVNSSLSPNTKIIALGGTATVTDQNVEDLTIKSVHIENGTTGNINSNADILKADAKFASSIIDGNLYIDGNKAQVSDTKVTGTIFVNPGKTGVTILKNVTAKNIVIRSGASESIHLDNVKADFLSVESSSNVHVESQGNTSIANTVVKSQAIMDASSGTFGKVSIDVVAENSAVELKGTFKDSVIVEGAVTLKTDATAQISNVTLAPAVENSKITLDGKFANVEVSKGAEVQTTANTQVTNNFKMDVATNVQTVTGSKIANVEVGSTVQGSANITGAGTITNIQNKSESVALSLAKDVAVSGKIESVSKSSIVSENTSIASKVEQKSSTEISTPSTSSTSTRSTSSSSSSGSSTVSVISISVSNNESKNTIETDKGQLQLTATITPSTATNKNVKWSVDNTNIATIDDKGILTAKANGIVDIIATSTDGTKVTGKYSVTITGQLDANSIVNFKDENLEKAVRDAINKPTGDIYKSDVENITDLDASGKFIEDISGIENFSRLKSLKLGGNHYMGMPSNQISDISALKGLANLQNLDLYSNQINDISALKDLTNLENLNLGCNRVSDISALKDLTNLQNLDLENNNIADISALKNLSKLQILNLEITGAINIKENQISDISALKGLVNLQNLYLSDNKISDIGALQGLSSLQNLNLEDNQVSDISALKGLTNLKSLHLENNKIININALQGLINLQELNLGCNPISDISALQELNNLQILYLADNQISDISGLSGLSNLQNLYLAGNPVADISALGSLRNLNSLGLYDTPTSDISALKYLTSLQKLELFDNQISDISALQDLTNLQSIDLRNNPISNISSLQGLRNLTLISLYGNQISDISALKDLTNLKNLTIGDNSVADISAVKDLINLQSLYLQGNQVSDISTLKGLVNLQNLYLSDNKISDIGALQGLSSLQNLNLEDNQVSDISALKGLINLQWLGLLNNPVSDADIRLLKNTLSNCYIHTGNSLVNFKDKNLEQAVRDAINKPTGEIYKSDVEKITELYASSRAIQDISGIENLTNLEYLNLADNQISDINGLQGLANLQRLYLSGNQISDVSLLQGLINLQDIRLDYNQISNISGLGGLINLQYLHLYNNQINDINVLKNLTNLKELSLDNNQISDINGLGGLTNLQSLHLYNTQISDISALKDLTNLQSLDLNYNQISDINALKGLVNLQNLYLIENQISDISALKDLTNLQYLHLYNNQISTTDMELLKNALVNCTIIF